MTTRTMIDLFSGLGGFSLAGLAHGVEPVAAEIIGAMVQAETETEE